MYKVYATLLDDDSFEVDTTELESVEILCRNIDGYASLSLGEVELLRDQLQAWVDKLYGN